MRGQGFPLPTVQVRHPWAIAAWVIVAYATASLLFWWPLPLHFRSAIYGSQPAAWALLTQLATSASSSAHPPTGPCLLAFFGGFGRLIGLSPTVLLNALLIGATVASGLAGHLLGRALSGQHLGGFVAGMVFASSPLSYANAVAGAPDIGFVVPLNAWLAIRLVRQPNLTNMFWLFLALAVAGGGPGWAFSACLLVQLGIALWQVATLRHRAAGWLLLPIALLAAAYASAPAEVAPLRAVAGELDFGSEDLWVERQRIRDDPMYRPSQEAAERQTTLDSVLASSSNQAFLHPRFSADLDAAGVGLLAMSLGCIGAAVARKRGLGWVGISLVGAVLSLGPRFRPDSLAAPPEWLGDLVLPYAWLHDAFSAFDPDGIPRHFGYLALTGLAALSAVSFAIITSEARRWSTAVVAATFAGGFAQPALFVPLAVRYSVVPTFISPGYVELATLPEGEVLDLPLRPSAATLSGARAAYRATAHRHAPFGTGLGQSGATLLANPLLARLLETSASASNTATAAEAFEALTAAGLRYVAIRTAVASDEVSFPTGTPTPDLAAEPWFSVMDAAFGPPAQSDGRSRIYQISAGGGLPPESGAMVIPIRSSLDYAAFHLPVALDLDGALTLYRGPARQVSLWVLGESGSAVTMRIRSGATSRTVPLAVSPTEWRWFAVPIPEVDTVAVSMESPDGRVQFRMTRAQVLL